MAPAEPTTGQPMLPGDGSGGSGSSETCGLQSMMKPLLEHAIRESLKELARNATQENHSGYVPGSLSSAPSIENLVRDVAGRVLEEAGPGLVEAMSSAEALGGASPASRAACEGLQGTPPVEPQPLLLDLSSTPWSMWREVMEDSPRASVPPSPGNVALAEAWPSPPKLAAGLQESLDSDSSYGEAEDSHLARKIPRSQISPLGGFCDQPIVVHEGLTMDSRGAQHLRMQWQARPKTVLIVAKPGDRVANATVQDMVAWLSSQGIVVVLEAKLLANLPQLRRSSQRGIRTFSKADELEKHIDLVITIGGDGTLTWAVSLFRGALPPVLSFAAGSLGFLTPHPLGTWVRTLTRLLDLHRARRPLPLVCRMRLTVTIVRRGDGSTEHKRCQVQCLNEVLVHRGQSGSLAKLNVGVDGEQVTLVQGDGLILATPTGSTAYSLAAGGSMVHPSVPAILLTPVSPHSLSFRPAVLPDSAVVTVGVPLTARCGAALSIDGKDICNLHLGDSVEVSMSQHPVPTVCKNTASMDWFTSVDEGLQWNRREEQK